MDFSTATSSANRRSLPPRLIVTGVVVALVLMALFLVLSLGDNPTSEEVVAAFEERGLEVGQTSEIPTEGYGPVPATYEEATRFEIPSLGPDSGGRVFSGPEDEVRSVAAYYRAFGAPQSVLGSWVFVSEGVVVQINGELAEDRAREYQEVVELLD